MQRGQDQIPRIGKNAFERELRRAQIGLVKLHRQVIARGDMLLRTHHHDAPWIMVRADDKHQAQLNLIRDMLMRIPTAQRRRRVTLPDRRVVREFSAGLLEVGWLAR
jgi:hypothetical protein